MADEKQNNKIIGIRYVILSVSFFLLYYTLFIFVYSQSDEVSLTSQLKKDNNILRIVGEIKNLLDTAITNITMAVSFYDESGQIISNQTRFSELRTVNPYSISPYEIMFYDPKNIEKIENYTIRVNYNKTHIKDQLLFLKENKSRLDITGNYFVYGAVENRGNETSYNTNVIVTFYDAEGKVIGIGRGQTEHYDIPANSAAGFGIVFFNRDLLMSNSYKIYVESLNYITDTN